jgi:alkaline phosphatase isozyme conversion protein
VIRRSMILMVLLAGLMGPITLSAAQEGNIPDFVTLITADDVMVHIQALSVDIGARPMGSRAEARAADYIAAAFSGWGYEVEIQDFETVSEEDDSEQVLSRNVIATRPGDDQIVVVGAHMDSVTNGTGAGDNASGVAAMLAAAEAMSNVETEHTLVFVAFGAEEGGMLGSDYYVTSLGDGIDNVIAMLNLDSVGMGTTTNVYAGATVTWPGWDEEGVPELEGGPTWVRDLALDLADEMNLSFGTSPEKSWDGFTGDWSDHYPFVLAGVPVAYFEAWDWEAGKNPWWGQETAEGDLMHTRHDVYENIVPEKVETTAELVAATATVIATGMAVPPGE